MAVVIRFAEEKDLSVLVELCRLHTEYEQSEYSIGRKKDLLKEHLFKEEPSLYCLISELDGEAIGYATYMRQFSTWDACHYVYMDCLFLNEHARGKGIGEQLIDRIKLETKKLGCDLIQWQTPDFNTRAMKFYDRIGAHSKTKERYFLNVE